MITKSKKGRVVILVRDMSSGPVLHFYRVSSNIPKGIQVTEWTRSLILTPTGSIPKTIRPPLLVGGEGKMGEGGDICFLFFSENGL